MEFFAQGKWNIPVNTYSHMLSKHFPGDTYHEGARGGAGS